MAEYRVNEIGALIFKDTRTKPSTDELIERIEKLEKRIEKLEKVKKEGGK